MASIAELIDAFADAFNRNGLDAVMAAFADDAEYLRGDGMVHRDCAHVDALELQDGPKSATITPGGRRVLRCPRSSPYVGLAGFTRC